MWDILNDMKVMVDEICIDFEELKGKLAEE